MYRVLFTLTSHVKFCQRNGIRMTFVIADLLCKEKLWPVVIPQGWLTDNGKKCWWPEKNCEKLASRSVIPSGPGWIHYDCIVRKTYGGSNLFHTSICISQNLFMVTLSRFQKPMLLLDLNCRLLLCNPTSLILMTKTGEEVVDRRNKILDTFHTAHQMTTTAGMVITLFNNQT